MNKSMKCPSFSLICLAGFMLVCCGGKETSQNETVTIEMETYYYVFERAVSEFADNASDTRSWPRHAFITVPVDMVAGLDYGDSVLVFLEHTGRRLELVTVEPMGHPIDSCLLHILSGKYIGIDDSTGGGCIGFLLAVSDAEYEATRHGRDARKAVLVHFVKTENGLRLNHMEVLREEAGKPVMFK